MILLLVVIFLLLLLMSDSCTTNRENIEGLYTFNSRLSIDSQYFHDNLLDNAYYFPNEYNHSYNRGENIGPLYKLGMNKCIEQCPGSCMEYGVTGNAYCYV